MGPKHKVVLVTEDSLAETTVMSLLGDKSDFGYGGSCRDLPALTTYLERSPAPLVVVDIDPDPVSMLDRLNPIVNRFEGTRFIAMASQVDTSLVLRAMQVGIRHLQVKEEAGADLGDILKQLTPRAFGEPRLRGNAVTLLSASGGSGATTIAINLANEIQLAARTPVLIADLDYDYGAVGTYLGVHGEYSVADVIGKNGNIDSELISSTTLGYSDNLHVLLSPASVSFARPRVLLEDRLDPFLTACRQAYRWTVIDAPRVSVEAAAKLAGASMETLVILQLTIKDVRITEVLINALVSNGVDRSKLRIVVNRYRKNRQMIPLQDAEKVLGDISLVRLSNDFRSAVRAMNYGEPLSRTAGRSPLRRELAELAGALVQSDPKNVIVGGN